MSLNTFLSKVEPDYVAPEIKVPYTLRRFDRGDDRYYHTVSRGKIKNSYISITSLCSKVLPIGEGLKRYIGNLGWEGSQKHMSMLAERGTVYHIEALRPFKENGKYSFREFEKRLPKLLPYWCRDYAEEWAEGLKRDLLCWFLFCRDRVVKVHAIELSLKSDKWGFATTIDFVADIKFNKKIVRAIVDLKSGKKGFFPAHQLQLKGCREAWNEAFPKLPVTHLFNFAPVDYRKEVNYKLENQTTAMTGKVSYGKETLTEWELHLLQAKAQGLVRPPRKFDAVLGAFKGFENFDPKQHSFTYNFG